MIYSVTELLNKLKGEHDSSCFYRGQNKLFDFPLWPSFYRGSAIINPMEISGKIGYYGRGNYFGFRSGLLIDKKYSNPEILKLRELERVMMGYARNGLGYCLAEAMFQQAGWESQGLDVTSNINIALFFATHFYHHEGYQKDQSSNIRVIYRWKIPKEDWSLDRLNNHNFYNCPALFPSKDILNLFQECDDDYEFKDSIRNYREAINWNNDFDLNAIQGHRPFEIIKIPKKWKQTSRIVEQDAALLFPDSISIERFNSQYTINSKECQEIMSYGGTFIEDLSTAYNCEIFCFKIDPQDFNLLDIDEKKIYIKNDFSHLFLMGWMKSFHLNPWGNIKIMISCDNECLTKLDEDMNFSQLRFQDNEKLFNG